MAHYVLPRPVVRACQWTVTLEVPSPAYGETQGAVALCSVVAGLSLLAGGNIANIAAYLLKIPQALFLTVGDYTCAGGLTDRECEGIITERSVAI